MIAEGAGRPYFFLLFSFFFLGGGGRALGGMTLHKQNPNLKIYEHTIYLQQLAT